MAPRKALSVEAKAAANDKRKATLAGRSPEQVAAGLDNARAGRDKAKTTRDSKITPEMRETRNLKDADKATKSAKYQERKAGAQSRRDGVQGRRNNRLQRGQDYMKDQFYKKEGRFQAMAAGFARNGVGKNGKIKGAGKNGNMTEYSTSNVDMGMIREAAGKLRGPQANMIRNTDGARGRAGRVLTGGDRQRAIAANQPGSTGRTPQGPRLPRPARRVANTIVVD